MIHRHTERFLVSLAFLPLLAVLPARMADAQAILLTAPPAQPGTVVTAAYPMGTTDPADANDPYYSTVCFIDGPFTVAAGSTSMTFTATSAAPQKSFESFTNDGSFDFPVGAQLVDTGIGDSEAAGNMPTGPLRIDFSGGVSAFGLNAQDNAFDSETFLFTVYINGSTAGGTTFTTPAYDNTVNPSGKSVFLGAQAIGGAVITSVVISSASVAVNNGMVSTANSNDFYFGPLSAAPAAVPEASTLVSLGLLLALGGIVAVVRRTERQL